MNADIARGLNREVNTKSADGERYCSSLQQAGDTNTFLTLYTGFLPDI